MRFNKIVILISSIGFCNIGYCQTSPGPNVKQIICIRHGEKPDKGDNLSCKGLNRALQLPAVLKKKIGPIDYIFVPALKNGKSTTHSRMFQTISPYAIQQNLAINTKYDEADIKGVSSGIKYLNGTVLLVWEHKNILKIVKELGIKENLKWDENDYNSIFIITFNKDGAMLKRDTENLNPADKCNN